MVVDAIGCRSSLPARDPGLSSSLDASAAWPSARNTRWVAAPVVAAAIQAGRTFWSFTRCPPASARSVRTDQWVLGRKNWFRHRVKFAAARHDVAHSLCALPAGIEVPVDPADQPTADLGLLIVQQILEQSQFTWVTYLRAEAVNATAKGHRLNLVEQAEKVAIGARRFTQCRPGQAAGLEVETLRLVAWATGSQPAPLCHPAVAIQRRLSYQ